ncbi:MAG: GTP 3',8-cyclase MoaA [Planctomycetaceae bacterium]
MNNQLIDSFGRVHDNLRISVTDRCNLRCTYCMPADNVIFMKRQELLTFEEIARIAQVGAGLGIRKIRLTGGEPLVRHNLELLVAQLVSIPGITDIGLTTNGILLPDQAQQLKDAGLTRVNISLDSLDRERFAKITRRDDLEKVLVGIQAAQAVGFDPIKLNAVAVSGLIEDDIVPLGRFARETGIEVRFIEFMPLDADNEWERSKVLFAHKIIETLSREIVPLLPVDRQSDDRAPASEFEFQDGCGRIGLIASVSEPFCMNCNRFRITSDGKLRNCLFSIDEVDLKSVLRSGGTDAQIAAAMQASIAAKREGHEINTARFIQPDRPMYSIGG